MNWLEERGPGPHGTEEGDDLHDRSSIFAAILGKIRTDPSGCIVWTGALRKGYGYIIIGRRRDARGRRVTLRRQAHRVIWEMFFGDVPRGRCLDHLCRRRECVNPGHLDVVTPAENTRRGENVWRSRTHCTRGHVFSLENTWLYVDKDGRRFRKCRSCKREVMQELRLRRRQEALLPQVSLIASGENEATVT